jgi:valyl-tRNA synthetase
MIMLGLWFKDEIPFKNMFYHGTMRDMQGRKFSKSLGNGIDPLELIKQWGTDSVRMTLYSYSAPGRDPKASRQTMDERCKNFRNFGTKLRNITRFIIDLKPENTSAEQSQHEDDKQILDQLATTTQSVTKHLETFNLHLATETLYEFIWHQFADIYIEKTKSRRAEAQPTLEYVFKTCLELLHPFMPFLTEELWQKMPHDGESIMVTNWPDLSNSTENN